MTRHEWCIKVKSRDGNQCVICAASDKLYAHHIRHEAVAWECRTKIDNGVTLCKRCHLLAHRGTFSPVGYGKLTKEEGIRALEAIAYNDDLHDLIVRIVEGDIEHTISASERLKDKWRPDGRCWNPQQYSD